MLKIIIPDQNEFLENGCSLRTVNDSWTEKCLNGNEKKRGVYIFHKGAGEILYVGKTSGRHYEFRNEIATPFSKKRGARKASLGEFREGGRP